MFRSLSESPSSRLHRSFCGGPECFRGTTKEPQAARLPLQRLAQLGSCIQLQQRNCSRFSRDFLRRSTFSSSQRTGLRSSGLHLALQELFRIYLARSATNLRPRATIEPSVDSISSCLAKAWRMASRFSVATIEPARYRK
jgi:hypothetical protein